MDSLIPPQLELVIREASWRAIPGAAIDLAEKCAATAKEVREATKSLSQDGFMDVWYNKDADKLLFNCGDWIGEETRDAWLEALEPLAKTIDCEYEMGSPVASDGEGIWVKLATRPLAARACLEKSAVSATLNAGYKHLGYDPAGKLPGAGSPLTAGIASGLLGAGLGYGAGWAGEQILPDSWGKEKGKLRRTLATLGGAAGMTPAMIWAMNNAKQGKGWNTQSATPKHDLSYASQATLDQLGLNPYPDAGPSNKAAGYGPQIDVPMFNNAVWGERRLPHETRAAAVGLVAGASAVRGGARYVSPMDVARITAGMGTGWASGMVVGKVLGALTGMPSSAQDRIRSTGLYAGIVANLVPMAFGG